MTSSSRLGQRDLPLFNITDANYLLGLSSDPLLICPSFMGRNLRPPLVENAFTKACWSLTSLPLSSPGRLQGAHGSVPSTSTSPMLNFLPLREFSASTSMSTTKLRIVCSQVNGSI